jgi:hypothetical protein
MAISLDFDPVKGDRMAAGPHPGSGVVPQFSGGVPYISVAPGRAGRGGGGGGTQGGGGGTQGGGLTFPAASGPGRSG